MVNPNNIEHGRYELAKLFKGVGAEIGVERAVFSKAICTRNPETKLYGIDPWKAYKGYRDHVTQEKLDAFYVEASERMKHFNCELIREDSMTAAKRFEDESLDFVFIDANHAYEYVLEDIRTWAKKVKKGGIVSGHDYIRRKGQDHIYGVVRAVQQYIEENQIPEWSIWRGDRSPSWMFIKP